MNHLCATARFGVGVQRHDVELRIGIQNGVARRGRKSGSGHDASLSGGRIRNNGVLAPRGRAVLGPSASRFYRAKSEEKVVRLSGVLLANFNFLRVGLHPIEKGNLSSLSYAIGDRGYHFSGRREIRAEAPRLVPRGIRAGARRLTRVR